MVREFINNISTILQDVSLWLTELVPHVGATNLVLIILLTVPVFLLVAMQLWSFIDRKLIYRRLQNEFIERSRFIAKTHAEIEHVELYIATYVPPISAECMRGMEQAKRLCSSMREVILEMDALLRAKTEQSLYRAQALRYTPLEIRQSPLETVQLDTNLDPLPWEEWEAKLDAVLSIVRKEINESKRRRGEVFSDEESSDASRGAHSPSDAGSSSGIRAA